MAAVAAGHTVLAPNTELAAALFDAVERMTSEAGREIWPTPRVRDFGGWLREKGMSSGSSGCRHVASPQRHRRARIVARSDRRERVPASDLLEPGGAARAARRARRAIYEYGIPLRAVAEQASAFEESRVFLDWNRRFDSALPAVGLHQRRTNCRQLAPPPTEPLAWIESPAWRPMARNG